MQEISILILSNQQYMIGYTADIGNTVTIKKPLVFEVDINSATGEKDIYLEEILPPQLTEQDFILVDKSNVISKMKPTENFIQLYKATVSKLDNISKATREMHELEDHEILNIFAALEESKEYREDNDLH
jgi:hypothetical protein